MARTLTAFTVPPREDKLFFWHVSLSPIADVGCGLHLSWGSFSLFHLPAEMPQALTCCFHSPTISHSFFFFFFLGVTDFSVSCSTNCLGLPPFTSYHELEQIERNTFAGWNDLCCLALLAQWVTSAGKAVWVFVIFLPSLGGLLRVADLGMFFSQVFFFLFHLGLFLHSAAKSDSGA